MLPPSCLPCIVMIIIGYWHNHLKVKPISAKLQENEAIRKIKACVEQVQILHRIMTYCWCRTPLSNSQINSNYMSEKKSVQTVNVCPVQADNRKNVDQVNNFQRCRCRWQRYRVHTKIRFRKLRPSKIIYSEFPIIPRNCSLNESPYN